LIDYAFEGGYDPTRAESEQRRRRIPDACWKPRDWDEAISDLRLSDGGVYDNLGLEPLIKDRSHVLVSDGGGTFENQPDSNIVRRVLRWTAIMDEQSRALRKRWLIDAVGGTNEGCPPGCLTCTPHGAPRSASYWRIANTRSDYLADDAIGYSAELAARVLAKIRTDLDGFDDAERATLENHGYLVADAALRCFANDLVSEQLGLEPDTWPSLHVPYPEWLPPQRDECAIRVALGFACE
jgi:NTE family protein